MAAIPSFLLMLTIWHCNSRQLNEIINNKQKLKLMYSEANSDQQEAQFYERYTSSYDTETCNQASGTDCDHPSRKCLRGCNCNIETEDGYVYDMGMLVDPLGVFTITQESTITHTEYQYNVSFCRNNVVYNRNRCDVPASTTQYETANYPSDTPRCFNVGYWTHDDYNSNLKGTSMQNGFSFAITGDPCLCHEDMIRTTTYTFICDMSVKFHIVDVVEEPMCSYNITFKTKLACKQFQESIKVNSKEQICDTSSCKTNVNQQLARELIEHLIPKYQLSRYKAAYDFVKGAIDYIEPKSKDFKKSHQVIQFPLDKIDDNVNMIIEDVAYDLGVKNLTSEQYGHLEHQIKRQAKYANMSATASPYRFTKIKLNFEWGGTSHVVVGGIAFQKIGKDIVFAVSLYEETWTERENVKLNQHADIWNDREIEKYAFYLLRLNVKDSLGYL